MCGVVGAWRFDGSPVERSLLERMAGTLVHRGPDDEGYWLDRSVGLGHRRLSIIDLAGSRQPMSSADGRFVLTFNGEILNYRQLRDANPYPYTTNGDTEVLLAALTRHGVDALPRLSGQFAFGLFDNRDRILTLARDRLGILPLYYTIESGMVAFASEIKALLVCLDRPPSVDEAQLASYLTYRSVPAPETLFAGIRKLPAGHWLQIDSEGRVSTDRYWELPSPSSPPPSADQAVALVDSAFNKAVERALVADVPVGAYLSGGLDSSLVVAVAARLKGGEPLETFSAGFDDPRFDELSYAAVVSKAVGTNHHPVIVRPDDFAHEWGRLTWHRDAPVSEPADVAVARLADEASPHVKVLLSGEGSDELFAGYPKYRYARVVDLLSRLPANLRRSVLGPMAEHLPAGGRRLRTLLRVASLPTEAERTAAWFAPFPPSQREQLLPGAKPVLPDVSPVGPGDDIVRRMLRADCGTWLAENLLERGDRMTMASSVELRPPFLDNDLVELAFSLPSNVKVRRGVTKWVVKEVARSYLPDEIVDRRKVGFRVPLDVWMRGELQEMTHDLLLANTSFASQVFDRSVVAELVKSHDEGRTSEEVALFTLLSLEIWHETFIRSAARAPG
jgi:asparagine synthase (glutamine-hydrolysing)